MPINNCQDVFGLFGLFSLLGYLARRVYGMANLADHTILSSARINHVFQQFFSAQVTPAFPSAHPGTEPARPGNGKFARPVSCGRIVHDQGVWLYQYAGRPISRRQHGGSASQGIIRVQEETDR